jgi:hypothetical protein
MAVIVMVYSNVALAVVCSAPKPGRCAETSTAPRGPAPATHVTLERLSGASTTATELQGCPPSDTSGTASSLSVIRVTGEPA